MHLFCLIATVDRHVTTVRNPDRKSTRLNSSHLVISYAVFCLKKKMIQEWLRLVLEEADHEGVGTAAAGTERVARALELRPARSVSDIRITPSHSDERDGTAHE